jgi:hypothetical protein
LSLPLLWCSLHRHEQRKYEELLNEDAEFQKKIVRHTCLHAASNQNSKQQTELLCCATVSHGNGLAAVIKCLLCPLQVDEVMTHSIMHRNAFTPVHHTELLTYITITVRGSELSQQLLHACTVLLLFASR